MKVIITFTFCCDNLWKSKFMALEKPGKLWEFFLLLCGHPDRVCDCELLRMPLYMKGVCFYPPVTMKRVPSVNNATESMHTGTSIGEPALLWLNVQCASMNTL